MTIEAPTKLQVRDAMHCRLIEGTVTAEVPEPAHGFTIDTADLKVKDLGTRFGLTTGATGNSQVRVFQGEVEVGGMLSHASTIAREYGLPALANVKDATSVLKTGDRVRLDASGGVVRRL